MDETERHSALVSEIYDTALDPSVWPGVLKKSARFVGGSSASLYSKDSSHQSGGIYYDDGGIDPHYVTLYFEKYVKLDPTTTRQFFAEIEEPMGTVDLMPYDEFLETRFYKEWAAPQHLVDHITAIVDKSATNMAIFGVFRRAWDGLVDDEARRRMRLIVPHIRRAVLISGMVDTRAAEAATLADALDGLAASVFLVDGKGHVVHANAAGEAILRAADMLVSRGGRLVALDSGTDHALRGIFAAAAAGDAAVGVTGMALPMTTRDGERHVAHVLPLTSGARHGAGIQYRAVAALFVHKAALDTPSPLETIARSFDLTPSELRVLLAIVDVGGVPEVAEALGVADTTVKTHLGRVYRKTGTGRQADLVKLVAGFASPLFELKPTTSKFPSGILRSGDASTAAPR